MSSFRPLRILVVDREVNVAEVMRRALTQRGHEVIMSVDAEDARELPAPDVLVADLGFGDGIDLLNEFRARGGRPFTVFTTTAASTPENRSRLGADRLISKPFRIEELVEAVEEACPESTTAPDLLTQADAPTPELFTQDSSELASDGKFHRIVFTRGLNLDALLRDLAAFALRAELGPSARARIATAAGEIVHNSLRHAYPNGHGRLELRAWLADRNLHVTIEDDGVGFDGVATLARCTEGTAETGLARAVSLAEDVRIDRRDEGGTRVELVFHAYRVDFDGVDSIDLSELDFLTPEFSRRVLAALGTPDCGDLFQLSPALAVTVGRLLHGPDPRKVVQSTLWSS